MVSFFTRRTGLLLVICTVLSLLNGSNGEIPHKPTAGVTIVPPVKPIDNPQAYPDAEKENLPVFTMDYPRIQIPFEITLWVLLASFAKIGEYVFKQVISLTHQDSNLCKNLQ